MRKKLLLISTILLLFAVVGLCFAACKKKNPTELETPNVSVTSSGLVRWQAVEGAESYEVRANNEIIPVDGTTFNLLSLPNLPESRQFTARVRSVKGDIRSNWSKLLTYTHVPYVLATPALTVENGKLNWTVDGLTTKIIVTVNGQESELSSTTTQYDLSALQQDSVISVQFIGDDLYAYDSQTASVVYSVGSGKVSLAAPQNVHMDGYVFTFDAVPGADVYYLQDVYNTITIIEKNTSDRTNKNFVKAVWASNSKGLFEDSEHVGVKYYDEGAGTQEDPFLIAGPEQLRFVDYYESVGQSMYYKFKADVALPSYAPGEEEEYNNFYNLGSLSGVIDGNGYKLSNSVVYFRDGYSSLFDSIAPSGVIKNLVIDNANYHTWTNMTNDGIMHEKGGECSILAYMNRGTVDNITVQGSYIHADKDGAAALVSVNKGTVSNSVVESSNHIYGANEAGAFAIFNSGTISNCINYADISGETTVGGIVGRNNGLVTQCGNEGNITANTYGGGIVGYNYNLFDEELLFTSTVLQCYNYGDVNVVSYGGGIVGKNGGDGLNEVGKISPANAGVISCYNRGSISGANSLGGIVGDNYGFHEEETDLGVINCYNTGAIDVDVNKLLSTRIYLSLENCSWGAQGNATFYVYYWGATGEVAWPGVRMTAVEVSGATYYYADISIKAEYLSGVIFTRYNPETGEEWNKTQDIVGRRTTGNLLFKVNSAWTTADIDSSEELVNNAPLSAGGIAGFNNMINDCYYLAAQIEGKDLLAGASSVTQENKILVDGAEVESSACVIAADELSTFASTLNAYSDVWADDDNGPILQWQRRG